MGEETPPAWHALFDAVGGRADLARLCDVSETTVWRWSRGLMRPGTLTRVSVNRVCAAHGLAGIFPED